MKLDHYQSSEGNYTTGRSCVAVFKMTDEFRLKGEERKAVRIFAKNKLLNRIVYLIR